MQKIEKIARRLTGAFPEFAILVVKRNASLSYVRQLYICMYTFLVKGIGRWPVTPLDAFICHSHKEGFQTRRIYPKRNIQYSARNSAFFVMSVFRSKTCAEYGVRGVGLSAVSSSSTLLSCGTC